MKVTKYEAKTFRWSLQEKEELLMLFAKYNEIIDISQRHKTHYKHVDVRNAWDSILDEFNSKFSHNEPRTLKQIKKFWLNSRLRNKTPMTTKMHRKIGKSESTTDSTDHSVFFVHKTDSEDEVVNQMQESDNEELYSYNDPVDDTDEMYDQVQIIESDNGDLNDRKILFIPSSVIEDKDEEQPISNPATSSSRPSTREFKLDINTEAQEARLYDLKIKEMELKVEEAQLKCAHQRMLIDKLSEELEHNRAIYEIRLQESKILVEQLRRARYQ